MLKVTHVITGLGRGGAEAMLVRLIRHLDPARFRNRVVSVMPCGPLRGELEAAGAEVASLGVESAWQGIAGTWRLAGLLRCDRPDIVQSWLYHADLMATLAAVSWRGRLVWNIRCSDMDLASYALGTRLVRRLLVSLSGRPDAVIVNSRSGQAFHADLGYRPRRWELLPNGIDTRRFAPDPGARATLAGLHGVPASGPLIGHVARFDPMKDHAGFIEAAGRLRATFPDLNVVMAGRGVDSGNAVLAAALADADLTDATRLLGELDDTVPLMAALDLHVQSSAFGEGFPNVVAEAMSCGVPSVVTDVGDAAWLVGATGRSVAPGDPAALAAAMQEMLELPAAARRDLGTAARERIVAEFEMQTIADRYAQLYAELVQG